MPPALDRGAPCPSPQEERMKNNPTWIKPVAIVVAAAIAAVLIGGILMVPYRSLKAPKGYDMSRVHWNTKNSTRFDGANLEEVAALVSRAVYPATQPDNRPDLVILYPPDDWQSGLQAASLLRRLNAVLLPATPGVGDEIARLAPAGSESLDGAQVLLMSGAEDPGGFASRAAEPADIAGLMGEVPQHAIVVDRNDPTTALLAAPWAAYSGDMVVFDAAGVTDGVPLYGIGNVADDLPADGITRIAAEDAPATAVRFAMYSDPNEPTFGWSFNANTTTGYRAYTLARPDDPAMALLSANLARRGKPGPLLWTNERTLPQVVNNYLWTQRAAFWVTPSEGPFHHFWVLGDTNKISFPAQGQADYAVEMGPYLGKGVGASGIDMLAAAWVALGIVSALWILLHQARFLPQQQWVMSLAWPLLALMIGPFGILFYYLAYNRPVIRSGKMLMWDRPLWAQGLVATASAVGFGASLMILAGFITFVFGVPLVPNDAPGAFLFGTPMILVMIINYI
ncbi:MAG TPA: hypothetical protein ENO19_03400, partial [Halothiobacillaceae bacterium]|nr:hypothetical protein [Halothiobacillaceae bacterium]